MIISKILPYSMQKSCHVTWVSSWIYSDTHGAMANFLGQWRVCLKLLPPLRSLLCFFSLPSSQVFHTPVAASSPYLPLCHQCQLALLVVLLLLFCSSITAVLLHADSYGKFTEANALYSTWPPFQDHKHNRAVQAQVPPAYHCCTLNNSAAQKKQDWDD